MITEPGDVAVCTNCHRWSVYLGEVESFEDKLPPPEVDWEKVVLRVCDDCRRAGGDQ